VKLKTAPISDTASPSESHDIANAYLLIINMTDSKIQPSNLSESPGRF
jgi:hypothetical protein